MLKQIMKGTVAPIVIIAVWLCIAYALSSTMFLNADLTVKFWIIGGIPFGWSRVVKFIPIRGGFLFAVGMLLVDIILAGIAGSAVIVIMLIKAVINIPAAIIKNASVHRFAEAS